MWVEHVERVEEVKNAFTTLIRNTQANIFVDTQAI